jgi:hypothetical protein
MKMDKIIKGYPFWHDIINDNFNEIENNINNINEITNQNATQLSHIAINVKHPPLGLMSAIGDNTTDDTNALQAIINYCQTNKCKMYIPKGYYKITDTLIIDNNITIWGEGCNELFGNINSNWYSINIPTISPYLEGSVIVQTTNGKDAMKIQGTTPVVNLKDFGVLFPDSLASTGHGINATPNELADHIGSYNNGVFSCLWENIKVYGHDGNHYAFVLINTLYDTFNNLRWYGG